MGTASSLPQEPAQQTAESGGLGNSNVLALVFSHLPPGEQCFTASRVSREWAAWAAPLSSCLRVQAAETRDGGRDLEALPLFAVPLWMLQEAWPGLTVTQQVLAAARAARHGDLPSLRWALIQPSSVSHRYAEGPITCIAAAAGGHLEALREARAAGCIWGADACHLAAAGGHLQLLRWVMDQGCPWDGRTCAEAIVPLLLSGDPRAAAGAAEAVQRMLAAEDEGTLNAEGLFPALLGALRRSEAPVICAAAEALAAAGDVEGHNPSAHLISCVPGCFEALADAMLCGDAAAAIGSVLADLCTVGDDEVSGRSIAATVRALTTALAAGNAASAAEAVKTLDSIASCSGNGHEEPVYNAELLADTAGALPALLAALRSDDDATAAAAASAWATMAERLDDERADGAADTEGLLDALVKAMRKGKAKEGASCTLRHIFCACTDRARRAAAVPGVLPGLIASLQGSPRDASCAAEALSEMVADDEGALLLLSAVPGAHLRLATFLKRAMSPPTVPDRQDASVVRRSAPDAATVLGRLLLRHARRATSFEVNASVVVLAAALRASAAAEPYHFHGEVERMSGMAEQLGRALGTLLALRRQNCSRPLAEKVPTLHAELQSGADLPTIGAAAALVELARSAPLAREVLDAAPGLLNTLVGLLTRGSAAAARSAAQVLAAFTCANGELAARVLETDGAVASLFEALHTPQAAPGAAVVLRRLCSPVHADRFVALCTHGAVTALTVVMTAARGPGEQLADVQRRVAAAAGMFEALLSHSPELARIAAGTPGTLRALVSALTCPLKEAVASALRALGCIINSGDELLRRVKVAHGARAALFRVLESGDPELQKQAADALLAMGLIDSRKWGQFHHSC
jgi:hypothetical protein